MEQQGEKQLILHGNLKRVMWQLSWPAVLAMVLYGLNSFLDGVFVGRLMNEDALAGVGIAFPLAQLTLGLGSLIGAGAGTALSVWIGANDTQQLKKVIATVNGLSMIVTLLFSLPLYFFAKDLVHALGARGAVLAYGTDYFKVTLIGSLFWIHGLALNMVIRGEGKMKTAAWMIALGLLIDVMLKPFLIQTMAWGVEGAAWASNIGMLVYSCIGLWYFAGKKASFHSKWNSIKVDGEIARQILKSGLPSMILTMMTVVQSIIVLHAITAYGGPGDLSFYTACNRILLMMMMPSIGLMRALQPVIGMNFGAQQYDRVKKAHWLFVGFGFCIIAPFWLVMTFFPTTVIQEMLPGIVLSAQQLIDFRVYLLVLPFLPNVFMCLVTLPSIQRAKETSIIALLRQVIFYFPVMIFLPRYFGVSAIYWASTLIDIVMIVLALLILKYAFAKMVPQKERWKSVVS